MQVLGDRPRFARIGYSHRTTRRLDLAERNARKGDRLPNHQHDTLWRVDTPANTLLGGAWRFNVLASVAILRACTVRASHIINA